MDRHEKLREELLDLAFDCHDEPDALRARIEREPELRALWEEAQAMAGTLRAASRDVPADVSAAMTHVERRATARVWMLRGAAAAALLFVLVPAVLWGWRAWDVHKEMDRNLDLVVAGPRNVPTGAPAHYTVTTRDLHGKKIAARVAWSMFDGQGNKITSGDTETATGVATIGLDASVVGFAAQTARRLHVVATRSDGTMRETTIPVVSGENPPLVHLSVDKAAYRPGESIRIRAAVLDRLNFEPLRDSFVVKTKLPDGTQQRSYATSTDDGVISVVQQLPLHAPEGNWSVEIRDRQDVLLAHRDLNVLRYQAPRLAKKIVLDRETYAPGARGSADILVSRAGAGVAAGADVDASIVIDGKTVFEQSVELDAAGSAVVAFKIPDDIERGAARFLARVKDGGIVETEIEAFVVPTGRVDASFFPESGALTAGVDSRVYAELRDALGRPLSAEGRIVDSKGKTITEFRTEHAGRGRFELRPRVGERYELVLEDPKDVRFALPAAESLATTLRSLDDTIEAGAPARFRVTTTEPGPWLLGVFARGILVGQATFRDAKTHDVSVVLPDHAAGVLRATVFDARMQPVAERLIRRESARRLDIAIVPARDVVVPGSSQSLEISVRDETGEPVRAILGVTVGDKAVRDMIGEHRVGIEDEAWLCADVDDLEDVEDFVVDGPNAARNIDLLLGTRGWRRFVWAEPATIAKLQQTHGVDAERLYVQEGWTKRPRVAQSMTSLRLLRKRASDARSWSLASLLLVGVLLVFGGVPWFLTRNASWRARSAAMVTGVIALAGTVVFVSEVGPNLMEASVAVGFDAAAPESESTLAQSPRALFQRENVLLDEAGTWTFDDTRVRDFADISVQSAWGNSISAAPRRSVADRLVDEEEPRLFGLAGERVREENGRRSRNGFYAYRVSAAPYVHRTQKSEVRSDFTETVFWNPSLVTASGVATIEFDVSERVTTWIVSVDAHGAGRIGQAEARFDARLPVEVEAMLPVAVTQGDVLQIPVSVRIAEALVTASGADATRNAVAVRVDCAELRGARSLTVPLSSIDGALAGRAILRLDVPSNAAVGGARIRLSTKYSDYEDRLEHGLEVLARGFPAADQRSGTLEDTAKFEIEIPATALPGSVEAELRALPSPLATLQDGLEGMLREPHGCFEQTSSTTYPNIMALRLMQNLDAETPTAARDARGKLARGYERLKGFECSGGGFEWWGKDPAHEALTAYGLLEFADMARVHDVDRRLIERTRAWLLDRRAGTGFTPSANTHSFGRAPRATVDAYIVWALLHADTATSELDSQLTALEANVAKTADSYELALRAIVLHLGHRPEAARIAREELARRQTADGSLDGITTITRSGGKDRLVETTALSMLAWLDGRAHTSNVERAMAFLRAQRRGSGTFGGTQATVLAMKAICAYAEKFPHRCNAGTLRVFVGEHEVDHIDFAKHTWRPIVISRLERHLKAGANAIRLELTGDNRFPFTFALRYRDEQPVTSRNARVVMRTTLASDEVEEGKTVSLDVRVRNRSREAVSMPIALVGIPAGLEAPKRVLDALVEARDIAQWERHGRMLVLYWYGIASNDERAVSIDLLARVPGTTSGQASSAYLYYDGEDKSWAPPIMVRVQPSR